MALFTKKDLGLVLPDDRPGDPVSLRHTQSKDDGTEQFKELKPKVDPTTKVRRYRAGQVPEFAAGYEEERGFVTPGQQVRGASKLKAASTSTSATRKRIEATVITSKDGSKEDSGSRGRRSEKPLSEDESSSDAAPTRNALDDSSSEEDDDEIDRRRQAMRRKMMEKQQGEQTTEPARRVVEAKVVRAVVPAAQPSMARKEETESSGESGSEWETDSDESNEGEALMKPVFVPKKARETIKRQEELDAEEEKRRQKEEEKAQAKKLETRKLVAEELQREKEGEQTGDMTDTEMPDDTDGLDPEQEYRDWELREMRRIKRDRDEREERRKEAEETLRRRNMTEEERKAEDEKLKKNAPKEKSKWKFMQKYYHKGAFYMDDTSVREKEDVRKRDASGATLEDNFNKEMMPSVMQVKNFGKSGRTKYTHLAAEDTSKKDSLWGRNDAIREKFRSRLSGTRDLDTAGASKKRKTG
ncbi:hypothetical protein Poli38472_006293 [Pythium oligandrum]|uniref:Micro-fibrillar-associated protein 1 C-terminal domain-containing protein n=1 Tax=Pythium oligandrum TaxID=41045 RepID=A0A8K1CUC0_PYTOL|nr:hypothetical protein Poli38472_006293 [Pythium oligandrum]|eukprot:TMW68825.1 hypothetical protein Poli38472_006293 [Pythium oligandrum]